MVHEPEGACRGNWRARPVGPETLTLRLTRIKPARPIRRGTAPGAGLDPHAIGFLFRRREWLPDFAVLRPAARRGERFAGAAGRADSSASTSRAARCQCSSCFPCSCPSASHSSQARSSIRLCFSEFIHNSPHSPGYSLLFARCRCKIRIACLGRRLVDSIRAPVGWRIAVKTFSLV